MKCHFCEKKITDKKYIFNAAMNEYVCFDCELPQYCYPLAEKEE